MVTPTDVLNIARTLVDSNKDGAITPDEIIKEVTKLSSVVNALIPEEVLNELDVDGNGVVDINDLREKIKEFDKKADEAGNKDGKASIKERVRYLKTHSSIYTRIYKWVAKSLLSMIIVVVFGYLTSGFNPNIPITTYIGAIVVLGVNLWGMVDFDKAKNESAEEIIELSETIDNLLIEKDSMKNKYDKQILDLNSNVSNLKYENEYLKKQLDLKNKN